MLYCHSSKVRFKKHDIPLSGFALCLRVGVSRACGFNALVSPGW